jgi:hypothetical protein
MLKYLDGFTQLWVATVTASLAAFPFGCKCIDSKYAEQKGGKSRAINFPAKRH